MDNKDLEELTIKYFQIDRQMDNLQEIIKEKQNQIGKLSTMKWETYKLIQQKQIEIENSHKTAIK
jgi:hypothetical protein